ncbi:protein-tyrosine phosphatase mitochondrial 1 [Striga asiatica]|uniref:Protein-tyrosine phosphatase mitochondrial 1 n=1 Tax=Striga asiatica TaxID=4170 RepID=A0A5A7NZC8_STRAF|nr:protein-tyrosine phosphatase mitochondrial 1 [Striga asiatica]
MHIEELKDREQEEEKELSVSVDLLCKADGSIVLWLDAKRILVGAGARALFYPTLLYNVIRNKIQAEFRWWDWIDNYVLLGAVPFPSDIHRLKELGVSGVVTLNESYETLVPSSLYEVKYKQMMPTTAFEYVKSIRPRVLLASSQWKAVQEFYLLVVNGGRISSHTINLSFRSPRSRDFFSFDDCSMVVITESDLDGYDADNASKFVRNSVWGDVNLVCQVRIVSEAALTGLAYLWVPPVTVVKRLHNRATSGLV